MTKTHGGIFSAGVEREVLYIESLGESKAVETIAGCKSGGREISALMVALRKGIRNRVCGQKERQLNLRLV